MGATKSDSRDLAGKIWIESADTVGLGATRALDIVREGTAACWTDTDRVGFGETTVAMTFRAGNTWVAVDASVGLTETRNAVAVRVAVAVATTVGFNETNAAARDLTGKSWVDVAKSVGF